MNKNFKIFLALFLFASSLQAQVSEYDFKAAFIERFTRFIEWPVEIEDDNFDNSFKIAVLGKNPFGKALDELFDEVKIKGLKVEIVYILDVKDIKSVNLLFMGSSGNNHIQEWIDVIAEKPILMISDTEGFCEKGSHINMYKEGNYIRFEINKEAFKKSGLTVSSLLLTSAKIVKTND